MPLCAPPASMHMFIISKLTFLTLACIINISSPLVTCTRLQRSYPPPILHISPVRIDSFAPRPFTARHINCQQWYNYHNSQTWNKIGRSFTAWHIDRHRWLNNNNQTWNKVTRSFTVWHIGSHRKLSNNNSDYRY